MLVHQIGVLGPDRSRHLQNRRDASPTGFEVIACSDGTDHGGDVDTWPGNTGLTEANVRFHRDPWVDLRGESPARSGLASCPRGRPVRGNCGDRTRDALWRADRPPRMSSAATWSHCVGCRGQRPIEMAPPRPQHVAMTTGAHRTMRRRRLDLLLTSRRWVMLSTPRRRGRCRRHRTDAMGCGR